MILNINNINCINSINYAQLNFKILEIEKLENKNFNKNLVKNR
jgi:hypothetical protein